MVSPYLLRRKRSLEEAAAARAEWVVAPPAPCGERWPILKELHRIALVEGVPRVREPEEGEAPAARS